VQRLEHWTDVLWNPWLLGLFLLTGLYCSARSGFFQLFGLPKWMRATVGSVLRPTTPKTGRGITQWEALCTALASTIGTGSIAGVATAIWMGGPGAVFWMWVSAFLGMMTGFVEKTLAVLFRTQDTTGNWRGGPMEYLSHGLGSPALAGFYAVVCLAACFVGGNLVQANSIAQSLHAVFGWDRLAVGIVTALAVGVVMAGGLRRISTVSVWLVPLMALLYVGSGAAVLVLRRDQLLPALGQILSCALCPRAALGGGAGYSVLSAMRYGVARGVFTNEAGLGTGAIAHAAAEVDRPARQGMWGILEVGVATLVVCTITALVILVSGVYDLSLGRSGLLPEDGMGAPLTAAAFAQGLGHWGGKLVAVSLLLFAFSSILGWSFYGQRCLAFLGGEGRLVYRCVFLGCVVAGSIWDAGQVWLLVDLCSGLMAVPNLAAILVLSPLALRELEDWEKKDRKKKFQKK